MKRMRALVQKEIFEKSSNIPFLLKWFPMPETNHFLPWAFQKCHVVRKWFPFGNDFFGNHFHLEMIFFKWFTATKNDFWLFFAQKNDLQVRKIISFQFRNDFLHKKMISKELSDISNIRCANIGLPHLEFWCWAKSVVGLLFTFCFWNFHFYKMFTSE